MCPWLVDCSCPAGERSVKRFSNVRRVKSSPECSCAPLSSAARINYVGT